MPQNISDEPPSKTDHISVESSVESNEIKDQTILQNKNNAQIAADALINKQAVTKKRISTSGKTVLIISVCAFVLMLIGFIVPSEPLVTMIGEIFLYIGPVVGLALGILVGRIIIAREKTKHLQKTGQVLSKAPSSAIFFAILAFVAVFVSYAITFFVVAMFLSVRACELSGSSKCM